MSMSLELLQIFNTKIHIFKFKIQMPTIGMFLSLFKEILFKNKETMEWIDSI